MNIQSYRVKMRCKELRQVAIEHQLLDVKLTLSFILHIGNKKITPTRKEDEVNIQIGISAIAPFAIG